MKFLFLAIAFCLGAGLFAWLSFNETPSLIDQPKAEKASSISEPDPVSVATTPASEVVPSPTRFQSLTDPSILWQVRANHLRELDAETLSGPDVDALYAMLDHRPLPEHAKDWWTVVNEIMEQMRLQAIGRDRYAKALLAIIRDPTVPHTTRDYSIQHLMQWIAPRGGDIGLPHEEDPALIREAVTATVAAIIDPDLAQTTVPGTALNMLVDAREGGVDSQIIDEALAELDPWLGSVISGRISVEPINRYDAIGAVASLGLREYYPIVRELAFNEEGDLSLRMRSIRALGAFGEDVDLELLRGIADSGSSLRHAAQSAIEDFEISNPNL